MARRAGVSFEVDRLELEGGKLVVSGFWSGVRGLRFVRPMLISDERRILATLDHKPWAPAPDATWTAAFPWSGDDIDVGKLALAVTPQVTVPLGGGPATAPEPRAAPPTPASAPAGRGEPSVPRADPAPAPTAAAPRPRPDPVDRSSELAAVVRERDALRRRLDDAELHARERERRAAEAAAAGREDLARAVTAAQRDRDRALAQLAEAVEAREAAVRTRARMELAQAEALAARDVAEGALAKVSGERDESNAQRDEVLLAYRALQRHVHSERAEEDRADADAPDGDADEPLGVRTMPAARTVMAELQRPKSTSKVLLSSFDLWAVRVLGTVAAACFILLLVSILRVFI